MVRAMMLALLACVALQADAERLAEALRSDSPVERDDAIQQLKALGRRAAPALERLTRDGDTEVASRAKHVLACIRVREQLTPALVAAIPGVDERLDREGACAILEENRLKVVPRAEADAFWKRWWAQR